jgi:hypothetical protein
MGRGTRAPRCSRGLLGGRRGMERLAFWDVEGKSASRAHPRAETLGSPLRGASHPSKKNEEDDSFVTVFPGREDQFAWLVTGGDMLRRDHALHTLPLREAYAAMHCRWVERGISVTTPRRALRDKLALRLRFHALKAEAALRLRNLPL